MYVVPKFAKNVDAAKEFLLNLSANAPAVAYNSQLYNFPAFPKTVPQIDGWLAEDPFGSQPTNKLKVLGTAKDWSTNVGAPGPASPAEGEVFNTFIIPQMMAKASTGELTPEQAVKEAHSQCEAVFAKWRSRGLIG